MRRGSHLAALGAALALSGCAADQARPAVQIRTVEVVKEVQRPCPATVPAKPAPLARPLPSDAVALAALMAAKLVEIMGPGGYVERADAVMKRCTKP